LKLRTLKLSCCLGIALCGAWIWRNEGHNYSVSAQTQPNGPTSSAPIAVTPDDKLVWVANPDSNSVSIINVENDANQTVAEIKVGEEPNNLAIAPNGQTVYVANTVSGTVTVINAATRKIAGTIPVGTEPYGLALTPNGTKLY